jgi:hypothetical protein
MNNLNLKTRKKSIILKTRNKGSREENPSGHHEHVRTAGSTGRKQRRFRPDTMNTSGRQEALGGSSDDFVRTP